MTPKVAGLVVGKPLGAGTVARVFQAWHESEGAHGEAPLALKMAREGASSWLVREARLLARLAPPRGPRVLHAGFALGHFYFTTPRVEGESLASWLARPVAKSERERVFQVVALGIARALTDLHALGYAHGDVKPENVLVHGAAATLVDYGLAAPFGEALSGGTPAYLAPGASVVAPENDLYALGRVLLEILPEHTLASALSHASPGLRPSAAMVIRTLGGDAEEVHPRVSRIDLVRRAYLGLRADEIAQGCTVHASVQGLPRSWLTEAIDWERRFSEQPGEEAELEALSIFRRKRLLASVFGSRALSIDLPDESEASFIERCVTDDFPNAPKVTATDGDASSDTGMVSALLRGTISDADVTALLREERLHPQVELELARYMLARGAFAQVRMLLRDREDVEGCLVRAEAERRSGAPREALSGFPASMHEHPRVKGLMARSHWDLGDDEAARRLAEAAQDHEVLSLSFYRAGRLEAAEREVERGLASGRFERSRLLGIRGMIHHARGNADESMRAFSAALDLSQSLVEEASYGTGLAAAASDAGWISVALEASARAALAWESMGRPTHAARAHLASASTWLMLGSQSEAQEAFLAARTLAHRGGDALTESYAELGLAELGLAAQHLERAAELAARSAMREEASLRVLATRLALLPTTLAADEIDRGDDACARSNESLRWEWWGARARAILREPRTSESPSIVLRELSKLAQTPAPLSVRGPALAAAIELARATGEGTALQRFTTELASVSRVLTSHLPPRLAAAKSRIAWLDQGSATTPDLAPAQLAEFGRIAARFGGRDSLRALFDEVLDAMLLWTSAERGVVLTRARDALVPRAMRNLRREDLRGEQLVLSRSLAEEALRTRKAVVATDAYATLGDARASIHALKLRSVLVVPLVLRGEVFGVVYLDDRSRRDAFGVKERSWVDMLAVQAACAIADARDHLQLRRALRRAERARAELAAVLEEREGELALAKRELREASRATVHVYGAISGTSKAMTDFLRLVDRVTDADVPVLLLGESGTGKELVARAIHDNSPRRGHTFVTENCASVPENLLESTLFGHVRGAFTGASGTRAGLLDLADRGTLFLDEVGELPLGMQGKLLRVLQDGMVRPVGSDRARKVDVRIIAATNRDLPNMVKEGTFRADLFYRLDVATLRIPALRERTEDIPDLVHHFIEKHGQGRPVRMTPAAMKKLSRMPWPGNVRQLENEVRKLLLFAGERIDEHDLSVALDADADPIDAFDLPARVDALEVELVEAALQRVGGNQTKAAELLRVSRFGLQKMMKRLGIAVPR
ncbi:MAG: sigma 54-interacting transcriptional regulator [Polyangiaceae bacterium]